MLARSVSARVALRLASNGLLLIVILFTVILVAQAQQSGSPLISGRPGVPSTRPASAKTVAKSSRTHHSSPKPSPLATVPPVYSLSGTWQDSYDYIWSLSASGAGTVTVDNGCSPSVWTVTSSGLSGVSSNQFTLTANVPSGAAGCVSFEYTMEFISATEAEGTWENLDGSGGGSVTMIKTGGAPTLTITLTPQPQDDEYLISATPTMPVIQATAAVAGVTPDPTPDTTFTWTAHLYINENGGSGDEVDYDDDIVQNATTVGSATYTLQFQDENLFEGEISNLPSQRLSTAKRSPRARREISSLRALTLSAQASRAT